MVHTGFVRLCENGQTLVFADVGGTHLGVARVRCAEDIIKAAQQRLLRQQNMVLENAGHFLGQHVLRNTVVIIQTGLRPPADVQRGMNVRFSPVHNLGVSSFQYSTSSNGMVSTGAPVMIKPSYFWSRISSNVL